VVALVRSRQELSSSARRSMTPDIVPASKAA
jgi:hypothetical protein